MTSPRLASTSSAKISVTESPATASALAPPQTAISLTRLETPDGLTRTLSPGLIEPLPMRPENPRKSRFGRLTHCTGIENGCCASRFCGSTVSSHCNRLGPRYHGIAPFPGSTTL